MALFWSDFLRKELELGQGGKVKRLCVQKPQSWISRNPQMVCFASYSLCDLG